MNPTVINPTNKLNRLFKIRIYVNIEAIKSNDKTTLAKESVNYFLPRSGSMS